MATALRESGKQRPVEAALPPLKTAAPTELPRELSGTVLKSETQNAWDRYYEGGGLLQGIDDGIWTMVRPYILELVGDRGRADERVAVLEIGGADLKHALDLRGNLPSHKKFPITIVDLARKPSMRLRGKDGIHYIASAVEDLSPSQHSEKAGIVFAIRTLEHTDMARTLGVLKKLSSDDADFIFIMQHPLSPLVRKTRMDLARWQNRITASKLAVRYLQGEISFDTFDAQVRSMRERFNGEYSHEALVDFRFYQLTKGVFDGEKTYFDALSKRLKKMKEAGDSGSIRQEIMRIQSRLLSLERNYHRYSVQYAPVVDLAGGHNEPYRSEDEIQDFFASQGFSFVQSFSVSPADGRNQFFFFHLRKTKSRKSDG